MSEVTWFLFLQVMVFSPTGEFCGSSHLKEPYASESECNKDLVRKIDEWKKTYEASPHLGIIGKCMERK